MSSDRNNSLPSNQEAERAVLGTLILDSHRISDVYDRLPGQVIADAIEFLNGGVKSDGRAHEPLFFNPKHQLIFGAFCDIAEAAPIGERLTLQSICVHLKEHGRLEEAGGANFVAGLEDDVFALGQIGQLCDVLLNNRRRRLLIRLSRQLQQRAAEPGTELDELLEQISECKDSAGPIKPLDLWDIDRLFEYEPPETDKILGDWLVSAGELAIIVGPPEIGKSRLVAQLAIEMLLGEELWLGTIPIHRSDLRILIIQTENNPRRMRADIAAQLKGCTSTQREAVKTGLRIHIATSVEDKALGLDDPINVERLGKTIANFRPDLVVYDPYGDFFAGDNENDAMQTRCTVKSLMKVSQAQNPQTAVLVVHHARSGKAAAAGADGWERGAYGRGSKALLSITRSQINVIPGDKDGESLIIACGKNNNGRRFERFAVRLDPDTMRYETDPDFDFDAWEGEVNNKGGTRQKVSPAKVKAMLEELGGSTKKAELSKAIIEDTGCSRSTAYDSIAKASASGDLLEGGGMVALPK